MSIPISKLSNLFFNKFIGLYFLIIFSLACNDSSNNVISNTFKKDIVNTNFVNTQIIAWQQNSNNINLPIQDSINKDWLLESLKNLYTQNNTQSLWLNNKGLNSNATNFLAHFKQIAAHGIDTNILLANNINIAAKAINNGSATDTTCSNFEKNMSIALIKTVGALALGKYLHTDSDYFNTNDTSFNMVKYCTNILQNDSLKYLTQSLQPNLKLYNQLLLQLKKLHLVKEKGAWPAISGLKDSLTAINIGANIVTLRKRLFLEIAIPIDTINKTFTPDLLAAIKYFQYLHDIRITGKLDTSTLKRLQQTVDNKINWVSNNLNRLRSLDKNFKQPYVWVNVPQMQLQYVENDSIKYRMNTVVGRIGRLTPTLDATMTNIIINPNWSVPPTIMKEEIVPGIARKGGEYLTRRGLTAYIGSRKVDPKTINEKNFKRYRIEQKPGLNSSLGAIKFNLPNVHSIYLHDTPHRGDFKKYYRAYSSGCIRVEKPRDFAAFLIKDTNYTREKIDNYIKDKNTKVVQLKNKLDVHIVYITNDLDSLGNLLYLRDIYNKDKI